MAPSTQEVVDLDAARKAKKAQAERERRARNKKVTEAVKAAWGDASNVANLSSEQKSRALAVPAGLSGNAARQFILTGKSTREQIEETRAAREKRERDEAKASRRRAHPDPKARALCDKATEITNGETAAIIPGDVHDFMNVIGDKDPVELLGGDLEAIRLIAETNDRSDRTAETRATARKVGSGGRYLTARKLCGLVLAYIRRDADKGEDVD